jgi:hypothetical protein
LQRINVDENELIDLTINYWQRLELERLQMTLGAETLTTVKQLEEYLVAEYEVSEPRATELTKKHDAGIQEAIQKQSFVYFVGDVIANVEELEPREMEDDEYAAENDKT